MLFLVVGRTGTGKDVLTDKLKEKGLSVVKSYTTRPKRSDDEDTHIFISEEEADTLIKDAVAITTINGYRYFGTASQVAEADVYTIDPPAIDKLIEMTPDTPKVIVHITADYNMSRAAAIARGTDPAKEAEIFEARYKSEDERFTEFEQELEDKSIFSKDIHAIIPVENDYQESAFDDTAQIIFELRNVIANVERLVQIGIDSKFFDKIQDGRVWALLPKSKYKPQEEKYLSPEQFAAELSVDDATLGHFIKDLFATIKINKVREQEPPHDA